MKNTCAQATAYLSGGAAAALPPTRWSAIERAGDRSAEAWVRDLEALARLYRPVLVRHLIVRFQLPADRAEDMVQSFLVEKLLAQNVIRQATSARGRFRSFILKVFDNFVTSQLRAQKAIKRGPTIRMPNGWTTCRKGPQTACLCRIRSTRSGRGKCLPARWSACVTSVAGQKGGRSSGFSWRPGTLGPILDNAAPLPYEKLVAQFGLQSPSEASNLLVTAKRMFARTLREVVRETVSDEREIEDEILELKRVLSR